MTLQVKTWVESLTVLILLVSGERNHILLINLARSALQREINIPINAFVDDKMKTERGGVICPREIKGQKQKGEWFLVSWFG